MSLDKRVSAEAQAVLTSSRGTVLNIGSVKDYCGEKNQLTYAISKAGLMTLSRNLADALGQDGIRVNHFNLGWVLTPNEYALKQREGMAPDWPLRLPASAISGAVVDLEQYPMIGRNSPKQTL